MKQENPNPLHLTTTNAINELKLHKHNITTN